MLTARQKELLWFGYCTAIATWGLCGLVYLGELLAGNDLLTAIVSGHVGLSDFLYYYNASVLAQTSHHGTPFIYDPATQDHCMQQVLASLRGSDWVEHFAVGQNFFMQYPPQFFLLVKPLCALPVIPAWLLWCLAATLTNAVALYALAKDAFTGRFQRWFFIIGCFGSFPFWYNLRLGQVALFVLPVTIAFFLLLQSKRYFAAGLLSVLLLIKLQYAPPLVLIGLILGGWRYAAGLAATAIPLTALTVMDLGLDCLTRYPQALRYAETNPNVNGVSVQMMQNVRGELALLPFGAAANAEIGLACFAASLVAIGWLWLVVYKREKQTPCSFELMTVVTLLLILLFSLHTHMQDFLFAAIICAWGYKCLKARHLEPFHSQLTELLLVAIPALSWLLFFLQPAFCFVHIQPFFLWSLILLPPLLKLAIAGCSSSAVAVCDCRQLGT